MPREVEALILFVFVAVLLVIGSATLGVGTAVGLEVVCIALPTLAYAAARGGLGPVLSPERPRLRHLAGAALIGGSLWYVLVWAVMPLQERVAPTPPELQRMLETLAGVDKPLWQVALAVALVPAICEELLFRGAVLRAFSARPALAVVVSALLFAVLHGSVYRFLPTFLLGLSLGVVALAARSVFPPMLLHFIHNFMVLAAPRWGFALDAVALPLGAIAILVVAAGHFLVGFPARRVVQ